MEQNYKTIIPRNLELPTVRFLSADEEGKYKELVNKKYSSERARKNLNVSSSIFKIIELQNQGVKVATLSDLGLIVEQHGNWIYEFHIDAPAVVLRGKRDYYSPNNFLARDLENQIKKIPLGNPVIVYGLSLEESANSIYGLKFKTTNKTRFYEVPELSDRYNGKTFSKTNEKGIPIFDENGNRTLCTQEGGLSRLGVFPEGDFKSDQGDLASSNSDGRIIVVNDNLA
ncbi:hypothetical protein KAJ38_00585 [Candidatus Pacearchaeota archaeon]|nr:hypothetical protein [Candidatus Pacearchaeota archaeon]